MPHLTIIDDNRHLGRQRVKFVTHNFSSDCNGFLEWEENKLKNKEHSDLYSFEIIQNLRSNIRIIIHETLVSYFYN